MLLLDLKQCTIHGNLAYSTADLRGFAFISNYRRLKLGQNTRALGPSP
jgi:hypothetical protein